MILEKEINELFELSKKAIEKKTAWAIDFTIGATGPLCGDMIKETPEIENLWKHHLKTVQLPRNT